MARNVCNLIKTDCGYYLGGECCARDCAYKLSTVSKENIELLRLRYMAKILDNQKQILKRIAALEQQINLK